MKTSEFLFLGGLAAFAGAALVASSQMPYSSGQTFGPGFLPLNMAVLILVFVAISVIRALVARRRGDKRIVMTEGNGAEVASTVSRKGIGIVLSTVAMLAATIAAAHLGSLLLPLGLCILVVTALFLERGWAVGFISTIATLATIYAIFDLWLQIPLS